jgi:hypothetical protein
MEELEEQGKKCKLMNENYKMKWTLRDVRSPEHSRCSASNLPQ